MPAARRATMWRVRPRTEDGASAVELALLLPMLVMLLLGMVTGGLAYSDHLSITNAVREGARFASGIDYNTAPTTPQTWADSVQSRVRQAYANPASSLTTDQVCVQLLDSTGAVIATPTVQGTSCGTEPTTPTTVAAGACTVKVWLRKPASITLAVLPAINFNISAASVSVYGRTVGACTAS